MTEPDITELFPDAEPMTGRTAPASGRARLLWVLSICVVLVVLAAVAVPLAKAVIYPPSSRGECFILQPNSCVSLHRAEIERAFEVQLSDDVVVVESGSSRSLKIGNEHATLSVTPSQVPNVLAGYLPTEREPSLDGTRIERLEQVLVNDRAGATAIVGTREDGGTLIHLSKIWDG